MIITPAGMGVLRARSVEQWGGECAAQTAYGVKGEHGEESGAVVGDEGADPTGHSLHRERQRVDEVPDVHQERGGRDRGERGRGGVAGPTHLTMKTIKSVG
ncbi:hypothetical protein [Streptomyces sp. NPDC085529]|uniref:hypothetical protein n=1 Tax=Streptomyces sp. NPDC085529 TaxID=3365729 RepID=UPI0037D0FF4D